MQDNNPLVFSPCFPPSSGSSSVDKEAILIRLSISPVQDTEELTDLYTPFLEPTGQTKARREGFSEGEFHLATRLWLQNSTGAFLIQKRQSCKRRWPNLWDCTAAGSVISGETPLTAGLRELWEELGIALGRDDLEPLFLIRDTARYDGIFLIRQEVSLASLALQASEVADTRWASADEIDQMIQAGTFLPYRFFSQVRKTAASPLALRCRPNAYVAFWRQMPVAKILWQQQGPALRFDICADTPQPEDFWTALFLRLEWLHAYLQSSRLLFSGVRPADLLLTAAGYRSTDDANWEKTTGFHPIVQDVLL